MSDLLRSSVTTTSVRPMTCRTGKLAGRGNQPAKDGVTGLGRNPPTAMTTGEGVSLRFVL
jgi:hypothetical protein